ncbi:MAG TPA: hypothetical protein VFG43_11505 [Geminicoccaceae bacterium]|nr:hypothetical protein [Geminicoccaceae bacterium]
MHMLDRHPEARRLEQNSGAMLRFAAIFAVALMLALAAPPVLFAATLSSFLGLAAWVIAGLALFRREPFWPDHLTRWDVAAGLYASSLLVSFFVDVEAVKAFLQTQGAR